MTIAQAQINAAYRLGYQAADRGRDRDACPHDRPELTRAWLEGWDTRALDADENGSHDAW
jgi:ribosome modulation factor